MENEPHSPSDETTVTEPCADCLADRRRAALIGVGIGVAIAFSVGLVILPFVARR